MPSLALRPRPVVMSLGACVSTDAATRSIYSPSHIMLARKRCGISSRYECFDNTGRRSSITEKIMSRLLSAKKSTRAHALSWWCVGTRLLPKYDLESRRSRARDFGRNFGLLGSVWTVNACPGQSRPRTCSEPNMRQPESLRTRLWILRELR
jgi:hypothetical protein